MDDAEEMKPGAPIAKRSGLDLIFGVGALIFAAIFVLWVIPVGVQVPDSIDAAPLSPAFLPYVLSTLIGALGVVCVLQATLGQGVPKEESELTFSPRRTWPLRLALVLAAFAAFWLLPERIGMLPVAVVTMGVLVFVGGERNVPRGLLVSIVVPFGVWLFFTRVAQVPLPEGPIEGYLPL